MKSNTEKEQLDLDLDKFFADLETQLDENEVARLAQSVLDRHANDRNNLDRKILDDFLLRYSHEYSHYLKPYQKLLKIRKV